MTVAADGGRLHPLLRLFKINDAWRSRLEPGAPPVQPGSELALTDAATAPAHTSHAVVSALNHGIDHVHCLQSLLVDAKAMHTYAPFSLLRSATENFATATWLLTPDDPVMRARRRLQLAVGDARHGEEVRILLGVPPNRPLQVRLDEFAAAGELAGVSRDVVLGATPGFERIVREAGEAAKMGPDLAVAVWRMCSGITHGQMWASLSVLERHVGEVADDAGVRQVRLSASEGGIVSVTRVAMLLGREAWRLLDRRRLHFRQRGAPSST